MTTSRDFRRELLRAAGLVLAAAVLAVAVHGLRGTWFTGSGTPAPARGGDVEQESWRPERLSWRTWWPRYLAGEVVIVDSRRLEAFGRAHVAGAVCIPADHPRDHLETLFTMVPGDVDVVFIAAPKRTVAAQRLMRFLIRMGYRPERLLLSRETWDELAAQEPIAVVRAP